MDIYLDIDGVLLANDAQPALHVHEFLEHVTGNYPAHWLTTHCQGDAAVTRKHLSRFLIPKTMQLLDGIHATTWSALKTEAIDFSQSFLWFDDDLFLGEREVLARKGVLENWIEVDLAKDPHALQKFLYDFPLPISP